MTADGGTLQQFPDSGALALLPRAGGAGWIWALTGVAVGLGAGVLGVFV